MKTNLFYDNFDSETQKVEAVQVVETLCPKCHKAIRFMAPPVLICHAEAAEHWKKRYEESVKEIIALRQTIAVLVDKRNR